MGETTGIGWCDATFNPWLGCTNISPGCGHCYARTFTKHRMGLDVWADDPRRIAAESTWANPLKWARTMPAKLGRRPRVFCASLADVFEEHPQLVTPRYRLLSLICDTPELDWLVLTKRPEFARDFLRATHARPGDELPPNLWLGVSIENSRYTWRADVLRQIPAAVRFISAEPLLDSLFKDSRPLVRFVPAGPTTDDDATEGSADTRGRAPLDLTGIDWIICGGESGPGHRPMNVDHARELRDAILTSCIDCAAVTAEWIPEAHDGPGFEDGHTHWSPCSRPAFFFKQHGGATPGAGGKLLDGREWCEFPESAATEQLTLA